MNHPDSEDSKFELCVCSVFGPVRIYYRERLDPQPVFGFMLVHFRDGGTVVVMGVEELTPGVWRVVPVRGGGLEPFVADIEWMATIRSVEPVYGF